MGWGCVGRKAGGRGIDWAGWWHRSRRGEEAVKGAAVACEGAGRESGNRGGCACCARETLDLGFVVDNIWPFARPRRNSLASAPTPATAARVIIRRPSTAARSPLLSIDYKQHSPTRRRRLLPLPFTELRVAAAVCMLRRLSAHSTARFQRSTRQMNHDSPVRQ